MAYQGSLNRLPVAEKKNMVGVAQLVRAPDCGSGGRRFDSDHSPHFLFPSLPGGVHALLVVDDAEELEIAFRLLKYRYIKCTDGKEAYAHARQLVYELPYFIKMKENYDMDADNIIMHMNRINEQGDDQDKQFLQNEIETAYLEKEIERMYERLAYAGKDTGTVSEKLAKLKKRKKDMFK